MPSALIRIVIAGFLGLFALPAFAEIAPNIHVARQAIRDGDIVTLRQQIDAGLNIDERLFNGRTLLGEAVEAKQYQAARMLLRDGASPTAPQPWEYTTPLLFAVGAQDATMTALLLESSPSLEPEDLQEPMGSLAQFGGPGKQPVADLLIEAGADYDLRHAAGLGRIKNIKEILAKSPERIREATPLHFAAYAREAAALDFLLEQGAPVNGIMQYSGTPLQAMTLTGDATTAKVLLRHGANINDSRGAGRSPLLYAALHEKQDLALFFLEQGADYRSADDGQPSVMDYATFYGNERLTAELQRRGVKLNFHNAAATGNTDLMRLMLLADPEILSVSRMPGGYPLHWAVHNDQVKAAEFLLDEGADPDRSWFWLEKPVDRIKSVTMARVFEERGIGPNLLFRTEWPRDTYIAEQILEQGADTEVLNASGNTPLIVAMLNRKFDYARALVEHGADAHHVGGMGHSGFSLAVDSRHVPLLELMMAHGADINSTSYCGGTLLHHHIGCGCGGPGALELLIDLGADIHVEDAQGQTPIDVALFQDCHDSILLLERIDFQAVEEARQAQAASPPQLFASVANPDAYSDADPDALDSNGNTPLIQAMLARNFLAAENLLERGADPEYVGGMDHSGFTLALDFGNEPLVDRMLEHGANINSRKYHGGTLLHHYAGVGMEDTVRLLVGKGADVRARNEAGHTPRDVALEQGHDAIALILAEAGANPSPRSAARQGILEAIRNGNAGKVRRLLEEGMAPDAPLHGTTPLHVAAQEGELLITRLLLVRGADPDARDDQGQTPLHVAVRAAQRDVIRALLDAGADPALRDGAGRSALDYVNQDMQPWLTDRMKRTRTTSEGAQ